MACGCNSTPSNPVSTIPAETGFPTIADYAVLNPPQICDGTETPCGPEAVQPVCLSGGNQLSSLAPATSLDNQWLAAECADEGVTLLARVGRKLTRFTGSGFLQLVNGKASVVKSIRLQITQLYHTWWKPGSYPILGDPKPYPLEVVADKVGNLYGIKGFEAEDSIKVWDYSLKHWAVRPVSDFPTCVRKLHPRSSSLELSGFAPLAADAAPGTLRCLNRLGGEGLVMLTEQPTVSSECACEGCEPVDAVASVVSIIPFPDTSDETVSFGLGYVDGVYGFFPTSELYAGVISDLETALAAETTARTTADSTLQGNLTTEITNRNTAVTTVQNNLTIEANNRTTADATLQANIAAEAAARIAYTAVLEGTTNPVLSASRKGLVYVNTTTAQAWMSTTVGNSSADWKQITV